MTIGNGAETTARKLDKFKKILDIFQSRDPIVIAAARIYGSGPAEEYLGKC